MTMEIMRNAQQTAIAVVGRLDTVTSPALDKAISEDIADTENLVIDLKELEYISSAGLRVLLRAQKKMEKSGKLKLINVCESVMEVFEITGFTDILTIE